MKKLLYSLFLMLLVFGVVVLAFYAFNNYIYQQKQADDQTSTGNSMTWSGTITDIDLTETLLDGPARITIKTETAESAVIDVPSMGMSLCAAAANITAPQYAAVGDLVEVKGEVDESGALVPCSGDDHYLKIYGVVEAANLQLKFSYPKGDDGYVLESDNAAMSVDPDFITGYMLMLESDAAEMANATEPREGPPTIQVRVYHNPNKQQPSNWLMDHPLESNIELAIGDIEEAVVGGANAVSYVADGLYASRVYVVAHANMVYVFTAAYVDENSATLRDFDTLLQTIEFIPERGGVDQAAAGKLKADVFTGVLQSVYTGCLADGECFATVDGKKVTILNGFDERIVGSIIGVAGAGELEPYVGEEVEVYAQDLSDGTYTLYGSEGFYIKLLE